MRTQTQMIHGSLLLRRSDTAASRRLAVPAAPASLASLVLRVVSDAACRSRRLHPGCTRNFSQTPLVHPVCLRHSDMCLG